MSQRQIVITVADYQRIEKRLSDDLLAARREAVVFERRIGELEDECLRLQTELNAALATGQEAAG